METITRPTPASGTPAELEALHESTCPLPGVCETVHLPIPANFLRPIRGGESIPIGDLTAQDALQVSLRLQRQFTRHWRRKFIERHRMSQTEGDTIGVPEPGEVMLEAVCRRTVEDWAKADPRWKDMQRRLVAGIMAAHTAELLR